MTTLVALCSDRGRSQIQLLDRLTTLPLRFWQSRTMLGFAGMLILMLLTG
jgi:hypothetical protein